MTPDEGRDEIRPAATAEDALRLIEALATDDDFRDRFTKQPQAELKAHHVDLAPDEIPDQIELPSKEELQMLVDELRGAMATVARFRRFIAFAPAWRFAGRFAPFRGPEPQPPGPETPPKVG